MHIQMCLLQLRGDVGHENACTRERMIAFENNAILEKCILIAFYS